MSALVAAARQRKELMLLPALLAGTLLLGKQPPFGIYVLGLVSGAILALHATALVLLYRSNRIIMFAQVASAAFAALAFTILTFSVRLPDGRDAGYFPLARLIRLGCGSYCVAQLSDEPRYYALSPTASVINYGVSMVLVLAATAGVAFGCYAVVNRLRRAPRLIVTVATIFFAQALTGAASYLTKILPEDQELKGQFPMGPTPPRLALDFEIGGVHFHSAQIFTVVIAGLALLGVTAFVRRSRAGLAIRAAAENPDRIATLGVDVRSVMSRVWLLSGLLAGTAGIAFAMQAGDPSGEGSELSLTLLVHVLTILVLARFASLTLVIAGAATIGIFEQAVRYSVGSTVLLDAILVVLIGLALVLQRNQMSRAEIAQASSWRAEREIRPIPQELRSLPPVRSWVRGLSVAATIVVLGLPWALSRAQANAATLAVIYAMVGLSLLVLTGWAGQISLGQFAFAAIGGYAVAVSGWPFPLSLVLGAVAGAVAAVVVGIPALRLRGLHLAIITLALAISVNSFVLGPKQLGRYLPGELQRPNLFGMSLEDQRIFFYVCLVFLGLTAVAVVGLRRSRTGRALIAARDNEQAAQSFGIQLVRARLNAFALSGAIAAVAGGLLAYSQHGVTPGTFSADLGVTIFLAAVIGGFGTTAGPLLGAAYFGVLRVFEVSGSMVFLTGGVAGILLLVSIGGGISQLVFRVRDNLLRRVANRYGIVVPSLVADLDTHGLDGRADILPKLRPGGGTAYVPRRYSVEGQWAMRDLLLADERPSGTTP